MDNEVEEIHYGSVEKRLAERKLHWIQSQLLRHGFWLYPLLFIRFSTRLSSGRELHISICWSCLYYPCEVYTRALLCWRKCYGSNERLSEKIMKKSDRNI